MATNSCGSAASSFESATDFTVAVEEEFAILDPETLALTDGFERAESRGARARSSSRTSSAS